MGAMLGRLGRRLLFPSISVPVVWCIILLNIVVNHSRLSCFTWVMLSLHVVSFITIQLQPLPAPPAEPEADWQPCAQLGRPIPPRSRYVRRAGRVVLGFDHWCFWLGSPIGLHNRKAFVLYLIYSALLCASGASTSLIAALSENDGVLSPLVATWIPRLLATFPVFNMIFSTLGVSGDAFFGAEIFITLVDLILGTGLFVFGIYQVLLVLRNENTVGVLLSGNPFNVGWYANWCQVMGSDSLLWLLPLGGPGCDGIHWPTKQTHQTGKEQ